MQLKVNYCCYANTCSDGGDIECYGYPLEGNLIERCIIRVDFLEEVSSMVKLKERIQFNQAKRMQEKSSNDKAGVKT